MIIKEIFGVTEYDTNRVASLSLSQTYVIHFSLSLWNSEDANTLRIHTLSEIDDVESIKKMVDDSETEESEEGSLAASGDDDLKSEE